MMEEKEEGSEEAKEGTSEGRGAEGGRSEGSREDDNEGRESEEGRSEGSKGDDNDMGKELAIGMQIRIILDELHDRINRHESEDDLLDILSIVAGFIDETVVVRALNYVEKGRVRIISTQKTLRQNAERPDNQRQPTVTIDHLPDNEDELAFPRFVIPPRRGGGSGRNRVAEVVSGHHKTLLYVYPHINYCTCKDFQKLVLLERSQYTCPHWLAAWLADAMRQPTEEANEETIALMVRQIAAKASITERGGREENGEEDIEGSGEDDDE